MAFYIVVTIVPSPPPVGHQPRRSIGLELCVREEGGLQMYRALDVIMVVVGGKTSARVRVPDFNGIVGHLVDRQLYYGPCSQWHE